MDGFGDDDGSLFQSAPPPAAAHPGAFDDDGDALFMNGSSTPATAAFADAVADPDVIQTQPATDLLEEDPSGSAFFGGYSPAPEAVPVAATEPEPENDPRIQWGKKNADVLKAKDAAEAEAKKTMASKAKEHVSKFYEARKATVAARQKSNRSAEAAVHKETMPTTGTTWEKVHALINLSVAGNHTKDVSRFKSTLLTIKSRNIKA